jgi:hypothetical protein
MTIRAMAELIWAINNVMAWVWVVDWGWIGYVPAAASSWVRKIFPRCSTHLIYFYTTASDCLGIL